MKSIRTKRNWYLDSGCSRHMTGNKEQFNKLDAKDGGHITFGDNTKGKIIGIGEIGNHQSLSILLGIDYTIYKCDEHKPYLG